MTTTGKNQESWMDAIVHVLRDNGKAMLHRDIAEQIIERQLRTKIGATPYATVSATITTEIKQNGQNSAFIRTKPGEYFLNANSTATSQAQNRTNRQQPTFQTT